MHHAIFLGQLAGLLSITAIIPYVRSILRGDTKPNRASWLIWAVEGLILLASYYFSGATTTIWLTISFAVIPLVVFALSFKYGVGGFNRLDMVCLFGALIGLTLWRITRSPVVALYINILVDFLGFLPTIQKSYLHPETENSLAWIIGTSATALNVLALTTLKLQIALYPIYLFLANGVVTILVIGHIQKRLSRHRR